MVLFLSAGCAWVASPAVHCGTAAACGPTRLALGMARLQSQTLTVMLSRGESESFEGCVCCIVLCSCVVFVSHCVCVCVYMCVLCVGFFLFLCVCVDVLMHVHVGVCMCRGDLYCNEEYFIQQMRSMGSPDQHATMFDIHLQRCLLDLF